MSCVQSRELGSRSSPSEVYCALLVVSTLDWFCSPEGVNVVFYTIRFFNLDLFLSATSKGWKESIEFPDAEPYAESFEKQSNILEICLILKILGVAISSYIIYIRFLPISGHFQTTRGIKISRFTAVIGEDFNYYYCLKRKDFYSRSKKILIPLQLLVSRCQHLCQKHYFYDHKDLYISSSLFYFSFVIINTKTKTTCLNCVNGNIYSYILSLLKFFGTFSFMN